MEVQCWKVSLTLQVRLSRVCRLCVMLILNVRFQKSHGVDARRSMQLAELRRWPAIQPCRFSFWSSWCVCSYISSNSTASSAGIGAWARPRTGVRRWCRRAARCRWSASRGAVGGTDVPVLAASQAGAQGAHAGAGVNLCGLCVLDGGAYVDHRRAHERRDYNYISPVSMFFDGSKL